MASLLALCETTTRGNRRMEWRGLDMLPRKWPRVLKLLVSMWCTEKVVSMVYWACLLHLAKQSVLELFGALSHLEKGDFQQTWDSGSILCMYGNPLEVLLFKCSDHMSASEHILEDACWPQSALSWLCLSYLNTSHQITSKAESPKALA